MNTFFNSSKSHGFAILYAVLMVSIVLTISLTLLDITFKQLVLSSINKESKLAYYAAVSAFNCVLYWDRDALDFSGADYKPFGHFESGPIFVAPSPVNPKPIICAGVSPTNPSRNDVPNGSTYSFTLTFPQAGGGDTQAKVEVIKGNGSNGTSVGNTKIHIDGYNTTDVNNPRRVERSLESN